MNLNANRCALFGMVHVQALPGTPASRYSPAQIREMAVEEAQNLLDWGFDGIILENMHDTPYLNRKVGPEITATLSIVAQAVRAVSHKPVGLQVLAGANLDALAIAHASQLDFIRAEGFVFSHIADEGQMDAQAGELLRFRRMIGADNVKILADIKKKHSAHAITADVDLAATAHAAEFFRADGIIITGTETGAEASLSEIEQAVNAVQIPVWVGSGITAENVAPYAKLAQGLIVGSYLKKGGKWDQPLDETRARTLVKVFQETIGG